MNSKAKQVSLWERIKKQKLLLLMTVPGLVLTFIFKYIPMLNCTPKVRQKKSNFWGVLL
ncbi:ABC transporter membrane protein [Streptococcus pneumoniae]|nr:ABC transporter membrane protein [Streptococcus pneumoniae]VKJ38690.1 ABC transporter membrane protein [Streptococcus pneumoniae]VMM66019.1 ABC transporter membrane protein [Streptococcus pneumoniae]VMN65959.1 ABC transporter membrane protein [Streptococcus pneumoniae]VMU47821.1 ABC transporter membrane protein [Streptococcus pneumoniae]